MGSSPVLDKSKSWFMCHSTRLVSLFASDRPRPADTPRVTPIRVTCPKFTPASDPIGSLETWLAGVQNFHSLQRIMDLEDQKKGAVLLD